MNSRHVPASLLIAALLTACGGGGESDTPATPPPPPPPGGPPASLEWIRREWKFEVDTPGTPKAQLGEAGNKVGTGVVDDLRMVGGLLVKPADVPDGARVHVYSSDTGSTYWVGAQVPAGRPDDPTRVDYMSSELQQRQYFVKNDDNASLTLTVTQALVELIDRGPDFEVREPTAEECGDARGECESVLFGTIKLIVRAFNYDSGEDLYAAEHIVIGQGYQQNWYAAAMPISGPELWDTSHFETDEDASDNGLGDHLKFRLKEPRTITIPLGGVKRGEMFVVYSEVWARAMDLRHSNTYAAVFLRDPQATSGTTVTYTGLTPVDDPNLPLPDYREKPADSCAAPDASAGMIEIDSNEIQVNEGIDDVARVVVRRHSGSQGRVSVHFTTLDDGADSTTDYVATSREVVFPDGEDGSRMVEIPLLDDAEREDDERLQVELSDVRGCAVLGARTEAAVVIRDDDAPPAEPEPTYTVYVDVHGLEGEGLVIEDVRTGANIAPLADGSQALGYPFSAGSQYDVRVMTQPHSPDQVCSVSDGTGTVPEADVHVEVNCVTPPPAGSLDPAFGAGGKVFFGDLDYGRAVVVQSSGRIVVLAGKVLAGFHADGSVDTSFGDAGRALVAFQGTSGDEAWDLGLQADDKLVVVGRTRDGTRHDMAAIRFEANGTRDLGFGTQGLTTINPLGYIPPTDGTVGNHRANRVHIEPDGRIYLAGLANWRDQDGASHTHFATARLHADGTLDTGFGSDGSTARLSDTADIAYGIGVQSDGKVVLAGMADNSTAVGLARFRIDGQLDTHNPPQPEDYGRDGFGWETEAGSDSRWLGSASDLVMLDDDSIVVAAAVSVPHQALGNVSNIELVHFNSDGIAPASGDFIHTPVGPDNDVATRLIRDASGRFLLAAQVSSATVADFGVLRYKPDLTLDESFGQGGKVLVDFYGARDGATALALAPDGGIIVVGSARNGSSETFAMMRIAP